MNMYIRMVNGQPVDHPILEENFIAAFPDIDINNLPPEFCKFIRVEKPVYVEEDFRVVGDTVEYKLVGDVVMDVWEDRPMTEEEKSAVIAARARWEADHLAGLKQYAQNFIDTATTESNRAAWEGYLATVNSIVLGDPFIIQWPNEPLLDFTTNSYTYTP